MHKRRTLETLGPAGLLLTLLATSCATRVADFNAISTRNVVLDEVDLDRVEGRRVVGSSSRAILLFLPLGFPSLEEAVDEALEQGGGDLLVDAAVYRTSWWFLIGSTGIEVRGTVVNTKNLMKGPR